MIDEAAIGSLTVRQQELAAGWTPSRKYDVFLAALSWESRGATAIEAVAGSLPSLDLLKFESSTPEIETRKLQTLDTLKSKTSIGEILDLAPSTHSQENFERIEAWLRERYVKAGRPLKLLVDITCIPKTYILFLMGLGFNRDYVTCFDSIYAAGKYDLEKESGSSLSASKPAVGGPRSLISVGEWKSTQIPYLTASDYMPGSRDLAVAMGGELGLSLPFIERVEPGRLDLIFIEETAPSPQQSMLPSERSALADLMAAPNATRADHSVLDVIGVSKRVIEFSRSGRSAGTTVMALGSKSHAVALAVASLSEAKIEVITRVPAAYNPIDVSPSGRMLFLQVEDRFDPCSYIDVP